MKGTIHKGEYNEWYVKYTVTTHEKIDRYLSLTTESDEELELHPDDVNTILEYGERFDNIEARILANPEVEFEIVENPKMDYQTVKYAKLNKI